MAFLYNKPIRRILLTVILLWSVGTFYWINQDGRTLIWLVGLFSIFGLVAIWKEAIPIALLIFLSFSSSYAFYVFLFQFNLPPWLVMIGVLVIFSYLFTYTEQKIGILGNKRLLYLILFSTIILEIFLLLTFFLIDPINQSLIVALTCYLFIGYCYTILAKHTDNSFATYLAISSIAALVILATSRWGGLV
ncbi:MAG TPA: hypothetical protein PK263_03905 [bacterium]|nr:hypothetical protein [bacterium]